MRGLVLMIALALPGAGWADGVTVAGGPVVPLALLPADAPATAPESGAERFGTVMKYALPAAAALCAHRDDRLEDFALRDIGDLSPLVRNLALPICKAILADADHRPAEAADLMRPTLAAMHRLGGSHAQQDLLEQMFLSFAIAAGAHEDKTLILERVRGQRVLPPERSIGWRGAAHD